MSTQVERKRPLQDPEIRSMLEISRSMAEHDEATQLRIAEWAYARWGPKVPGTDIRKGEFAP